MDRQTLHTIVKAQFARDLGCVPETLDAPGNLVFEWKPLPGRRTDVGDAPFLQVYVTDGRLITAAHADLLPWCRAFLPPRQAEWLFVPKNLRHIEAALAPFGFEIAQIHQHYLPILPVQTVAPLSSVRWYEEADLRPLRGDPRWGEALALNSETPDMLAVAALDGGGQPMGMAGASQDCAQMWQIGINVLPQYQGRGLGANLTALLKQELLERDIVPFYSTSGSHIFSQNVGIHAGFHPAWAYLYAQRTQAKG